MGQLHLKAQMPFSTEQVWAWLADFKNIHRIHPMIGSAVLTGDANCGVGAARVCQMAVGGYHLKERVTEWKEGESYTVDIFETSMPMMARSTATFGVRPAPGGAEAFIDIDYELKHGALGRLMDALGMRLMLGFMMKRMFRQLRQTLASERVQSRALAA